MRPTHEYVARKFNEFNTLIFNNKLPQIPIRISESRSTLGQIRYLKRRNRDGSHSFSDFSLHISNLMDRDERVIEDTIIHEMIHYYILHNQVQDTSAHGKVFRELMKTINTRFNRNISISHKSSREELDSNLKIRWHHICITRMRDGQHCITVAATSRIFDIWNEVAKHPQIEQWGWYATTDPFFNRFRRSLTLKLYKIDLAEVSDKLTSAIKLQRTGSTIRPQNP